MTRICCSLIHALSNVRVMKEEYAPNKEDEVCLQERLWRSNKPGSISLHCLLVQP